MSQNSVIHKLIRSNTRYLNGLYISRSWSPDCGSTYQRLKNDLQDDLTYPSQYDVYLGAHHVVGSLLDFRGHLVGSLVLWYKWRIGCARIRKIIVGTPGNIPRQKLWRHGENVPKYHDDVMRVARYIFRSADKLFSDPRTTSPIFIS